MNQQEIDSVLKDLPCSLEARERVLQWLQAYDDNNRDEDPSGSESDNRSKDAQQQQVASISKGRQATPNDVPADGHNDDGSIASSDRPKETNGKGSTASQGGSNSRKGSTASQGGPSNSKGSTASQGGPTDIRNGSTASRGGPGKKRERPWDTDTDSHGNGEPRKRKRVEEDPETDSELGSPPGLPVFDPGDLVKTKDGTFKVPKCMKSYLNKHMKRCLTKEEREALFKEHPRPDLDSCVPPKIDKYMSEFLGKRVPKERDSELAKIQSAILASIRPLTSAWQLLLEAGLPENPQMTVPAEEVTTLIQCTLCMIGNASELVSQTRRSKILETIDPSWSKFGEDPFPTAHDTLFGDAFQSSLTTRVEKDTALSKAVSITKRSKKDKDAPPTSTRRDKQRSGSFFRGGPPARYGGRQGKNYPPYSPYSSQRKEGEYSGSRQNPSYQRQGQRPLYHEPKFPGDQPRKHQPKKP